MMMHFIVILLGLTGVLGKLISADSATLVWYRTFIAFISIAAYLFIRRRFSLPGRKQLIQVIAVGFIVALHWLFFFESIKISNVSVAVVCLSTSSLFSSFLEPIFFKRKVSTYEVVLGLVVIAALSLAMNAEANYLWGYIYGVIAAFLATLFTILNAKLIQKVEAAPITMIEMFAGFLLLSVYFLFENPTSWTVSSQDLLYLIILGVVCTAFAFVLSVEVMKQLSPYTVIMAVNLEPIYSIILALLLFGASEAMSTTFYIGGALILICVFLEGYFKSKAKNKALK